MCQSVNAVQTVAICQSVNAVQTVAMCQSVNAVQTVSQYSCSKSCRSVQSLLTNAQHSNSAMLYADIHMYSNIVYI